MESTLDTNTSTAKEYRWRQDGTDGLRSFSYNASDPNWNYSVISNPDKTASEKYTFTDSSTGQPFARRGNLYNWTSATLGSSLGLTVRGEQASDSLCPRGWQLPAVTANLAESIPAIDMTNRSFAKLFRTYDITQLNGTDIVSVNRLSEWPIQYLTTGLYTHGGFINDRTTGGNWWLSIVHSDNLSYYLSSHSDNLYAQNSWNRGLGFALRCVAKNEHLIQGYSIEFRVMRLG